VLQFGGFGALFGGLSPPKKTLWRRKCQVYRRPAASKWESGMDRSCWQVILLKGI